MLATSRATTVPQVRLGSTVNSNEFEVGEEAPAGRSGQDADASVTAMPGVVVVSAPLMPVRPEFPMFSSVTSIVTVSPGSMMPLASPGPPGQASV